MPSDDGIGFGHAVGVGGVVFHNVVVVAAVDENEVEALFQLMFCQVQGETVVQDLVHFELNVGGGSMDAACTLVGELFSQKLIVAVFLGG